MKNGVLVLSLFAVVSFVLTTVVQAEESPFYVGLNYGQSNVDAGVSTFSANTTVDEKSSGFKIYIGNDLNDTVSIEAHYANFGESSIKGSTGDTFTLDDGAQYQFLVDNAEIKMEASNFGVSSLIKLPISETVQSFVKIGVHSWEIDSSAISSSAPISSTVSIEGTGVSYGIGGNVSVSDNLSIRGEFERYDFDGSDVDYLSLGVLYNF